MANSRSLGVLTFRKGYQKLKLMKSFAKTLYGAVLVFLVLVLQVFAAGELALASNDCVTVDKISDPAKITLAPVPIALEKWTKEIANLDKNIKDIVQSDLLQIVGFSKDGKLAYRYEVGRSNECGECGSIEIRDLQNDKIIESLHYEIQGQDFWQSFEPTAPGKKFFFSESRVYKALLKNGIYLNCNLQISAPKFESDGAKYSATIDSDLVVLRRTNRKKTISDLTSLKSEPGGMASPKVLAVVLSPFQKKAAVVIGHQARGWEDSGATQIAAKIYGVDLTKNFE